MGTVEAWRAYLVSITNLDSSSLSELETTRLNQLGFTGPTLGDQWRKFMASEGFSTFDGTPGESLDEGAREYFSEDPSDVTFDGTGQALGLLLALTRT